MKLRIREYNKLKHNGMVSSVSWSNPNEFLR